MLEEENSKLKASSSTLSLTLQAAEVNAEKLKEENLELQKSFARDLNEANMTFSKLRQEMGLEEERMEEEENEE